jgi:outer membrane protein assembly factor BamB
MRYTDNAIAGLDFTQSGAAQGTLTISFEDPSVIGPGTYSDSVHVAICTDSSCTQIRSGTEVIVPVTYTVVVTATVTLSANPTTTGAGVPTTLTWSSTNAQSCTASGEWSGTLPSSGSQVVTPGSLGDHTYTLRCSNPGAPAQASVTVAAVLPVATLSAFPKNVVLGKTVTLRWQGQYAASCIASGDWSGSLPAVGFETLSLSNQGTANFHLDCSNSAASASADTSVTVGASPVAPPATAYRMTESHDGVLITSNGMQYPATSAPTWTVDFGAPVSYPLIAGGMVFVATANPDGSYGNRLYGLNAETGATVWGPVAIPGTYFGSGQTYDRGRIFHLMFDGAVRAFNASNGAALWSTQLPGYWYMGMPNAYGGTVFVNGGDGLAALDEASGAILWTTGPAGTTDWVSPAVSSEGVYTQGSSCNAGAYDPVIGAALWQTRSPCNYTWAYTPVIKNGTFFGRTASTLNLFDAVTGSFSIQIGSALAPAVTDTAVIALNAGTLSSTRLSDFVQTWTFTGDGNLVTAPVVVNNTVFVGSSSGKVYGLDAQTGAQVWMGVSPLPINYDSENGGPMPPSGPAAGENLLIFPARNSLVAWQLQ